MNITYLHQYFNTPKMSGSTRSYEMAKRLVAKGHKVKMITSWREDDCRRGWFETEEAGIRVYWLPVPYSNTMGYQDRIKAFFCFAWKAAMKAASLPADVILATSTPLTIALPGSFAARQQKAPMVFEVRDLWPEIPIAVGALRNPMLQRLAILLERFAYSQSFRIIALSPGMKEGILRTGVPAETTVTVIPNSSDLDFFVSEKVNNMTFRQDHPEIGCMPLILYAGTLGIINNVGYLVDIAAASWNQNFVLKFVVVGDGLEKEKIRKKAYDLGVLDRNLYLYPPVPKHKMPDIFAAADVALSLVLDLKPLWANSANKFFDALASGTPVAINYSGWQADLIETTGAGILLPPNDPNEAAIRLNRFISDKNQLVTSGHSARKLAEEHFNRDRLAEQLEDVLLSAAERT